MPGMTSTYPTMVTPCEAETVVEEVQIPATDTSDNLATYITEVINSFFNSFVTNTTQEGDYFTYVTENTYEFVTPPEATPYVINTSVEDAPIASEIVGRHIFTDAASIPASATGSQAKSDTAATASTTYTLKKNGVSFGTVVWSAAGTTGAFTVASATDFAAGDVYTAVAPASPDATHAHFAIVMRCTRL